MQQPDLQLKDFEEYVPTVLMAADGRKSKVLELRIDPHQQSIAYAVFVRGSEPTFFDFNELEEAIEHYNNL